MRFTSASHAATCPTCADKNSLNVMDPCLRHAAEEVGGQVEWVPVTVTAWDAALSRQAPTLPVDADGVPSAWQRQMPREVELPNDADAVPNAWGLK